MMHQQTARDQASTLNPATQAGFNPLVTTKADTEQALPTDDPAMSSATARNASYDYARFIAAIGIIWFHVGAPKSEIAYSGLAYFLILIPFLAIPQISQLRSTRHRAPAFLRFASARGIRLIVPWLAACVVYGALKMVDVSHGATWGDEFNTTMWLTGTALHLWFLPFAFVISLALWPLGRWIATMARSVQLHLCVTLMCLSLFALAYWQTATLPTPVVQWAYALPAVLLGAAFALTGGSVWRMTGIAALFFCMALSANWTVGLLELGIATAVLILCTLIKTKANRVSVFAARASLGLYLVHPAVAAVLARGHIIPDNSVSFAIVVILGSLAIVALWETIKATAPRAKPLSPQGIRTPAKTP